MGRILTGMKDRDFGFEPQAEVQQPGFEHDYGTPPVVDQVCVRVPLNHVEESDLLICFQPTLLKSAIYPYVFVRFQEWLPLPCQVYLLLRPWWMNTCVTDFD